MIRYLTLAILITLISCSENKQVVSEPYNENRELVPNPEGFKKDAFIVNNTSSGLIDSLDICNFNKYLNDSKTSQLAKDIFNGRNYKLEDTEILAILDSLTANDKYARPFYFSVVTKSYEKADGYYSEGLGNAGKEYVENNTKEFLNYFLGKCGFSNKDLNTWIEIVMLEISLVSENEDKEELEKTINKLDTNCIYCSLKEKEILSYFIEQLRTEWSNRTDDN